MEMMFEPPPGGDDLASQVADIEADVLAGQRELTVMIKGEAVAFRKPQPKALDAIVKALDRKLAGNSDYVTKFIQGHTSPETYQRLLERMIDPEDLLTMHDFGDVMKAIVVAGTARPTKPWLALR